MSIDSSFGNYPSVHNVSSIPDRTSKIVYANNDNVPPEKRGKEISDEDYKRLSGQKVGALKMPKAETLKKAKTALNEWLENYAKKPHKYNTEHMKENVDRALDIIQSIQDNYPSQVNNKDNTKGLDKKV